MSDTLNLLHLRRMKRRFVTKPRNPPSTAPMSPSERMDMLEKALNTFRSEVNMKLKIIQQILSQNLTSRNAQVVAQKKLLDREQTHNTNLLSHWLNTPDLAANELANYSINVSENLEPTSPAKSSTVKPSRSHGKRRKVVTGLDPVVRNDSPGDDEVSDQATAIGVDPLGVLENESSGEGEDNCEEDCKSEGDSGLQPIELPTICRTKNTTAQTKNNLFRQLESEEVEYAALLKAQYSGLLLTKSQNDRIERLEISAAAAKAKLRRLKAEEMAISKDREKKELLQHLNLKVNSPGILQSEAISKAVGRADLENEFESLMVDPWNLLESESEDGDNRGEDCTPSMKVEVITEAFGQNSAPDSDHHPGFPPEDEQSFETSYTHQQRRKPKDKVWDEFDCIQKDAKSRRNSIVACKKCKTRFTWPKVERLRKHVDQCTS